MKEFKTYHPIVNLTYFVMVICFACFLMHPVCLLISLASGISYSVLLKGKKALRYNLLFMLPVLFFTALINPLFNHEGVTVLAYFPNGNPLTLESVAYGLCAALMLSSVICHFSCFNEIMTSDKFIYLFGKILPSLSLVISMTLRFVPKFVSELKAVADAQKCMGRDISKGSVIERCKNGLNILSIMTTRSLENSIETADSMKARGYGLTGRTSFSVFKLDRRDFSALAFILISGLYTIVGSVSGDISFRFFPSIRPAEITFYGISVFFSYFLLCIYPIYIEIREVIRWKALTSKI